MPEQKYKDVKVSKQVYINSLSQYHFEIYGDCGRQHYGLGFGFEDWSNPPAYLVRNVECQIADMLEDGTAQFFERDQNGNERYDGLRYHVPDLIKSIIPSLRNPQPNLHTVPREIYFLVMLLKHSDFYIMRTKSHNEKRWTCYLIKPNDTEQGEGVVYTNLKHAEVEHAMHWLKVVRSGENQRRELYEYLEAQ